MDLWGVEVLGIYGFVFRVAFSTLEFLYLMGL